MRKRNFTKPIGLILAEETYNQLVEQTNKEEVTISEWIREAVEIRLAKDHSKSNSPVNSKKGKENLK